MKIQKHVTANVHAHGRNKRGREFFSFGKILYNSRWHNAYRLAGVGNGCIYIETPYGMVVAY